MNAASLAAWGGVITGGSALIIAIVNIIKEWLTGDEGRRAEAFAKRSEGAAKSIEATAVEHRVWMEGSQNAIERLEAQCRRCQDEVDRLEDGIYGLFNEIEDQIAPMLMLDGTDKKQINDALRAAVRTARNRIRPPQPPVKVSS